MSLIKNLALVIGCMVLSSALLLGQSYKITSAKMAVNGTSTLHDWTSQVTEVDGYGSMSFEDGQVSAINSLKITIPVKSIESTKGSMMDKKTWKAFNYDKNPNIIFELSKVNSIAPSGSGVQINASGYLTMNGTRKQISLSVKGAPADSGKYKFSGSKALKMTDYNMDPPTALLGTISTGDDVTVEFEVTLSKN